MAALALPLAAPSPAFASAPSESLAAQPDDDAYTPPTDDATAPPPTSAAPTIDLTVDPRHTSSDLNITGTITGDLGDGDRVEVRVGDGNWLKASVTDTTFSRPVSVTQGPQKIEARIVGAGSDHADATVNVIFAPVIDASNTLIGRHGGLGGSGATTDATVTVTIDGHTYTGQAGVNGQWSIPINREYSHAPAVVTQTNTWNGTTVTSPSSASVPITVDLTAPKPPTITSPSAGAAIPVSGATISGRAEPGSTVTVFAGSQSLCKVTVPSSGTWSCTAPEVRKSGTQNIVAITQDAAGNSSGDGTPVSVTFGSTSSPSDPPKNSPSDEPGRDTNTPDDESSSPTEKEPEPSESDDEHTSEAAPPAAPPNRPGPWNHATPFTESLPPAIGVDALAGWFRALLLAALTIALILIPARMLAGTLARRRAAGSAVVFAGRNRSPHEFDKAPLLAAPGRVAMIVIGIVAAGAITIFANPVDGRPAYLRLLIAAVIAAAIINAAAAWLPRILSHAWQCGFTEVRMNPRWLLVVVAAVLASRILDLNPALLFALVTTVRVPTVLSRPVLARLALSRIGAVFLVGVFAWLLASLVPQGGGFFTQLLIETANITALVGIGSAAIMMVPLGRLSGRAIFAWSRPLWLGSVLAILTALFVMLGPSIENWRATGNILAALALVFAFAALGISVWLWKRYVQPMLAGSSS
ncbi:Ig-like domain-containing protein [Paramicrobacterium agarici]|nr:Ig-like domain-containing protein [Microbacterium agarici]